MSLAAVLPGSAIRVPVHSRLTARYRAGINGRGSVRCYCHRVAPFRPVSVPISVGVGVSVSVLSSIRLGSVCASPRTVWMNGLSIVILRSYFALLQERNGRMKEVSLFLVAASHGGNSTSHFVAAALAFAQALEQKSCSTPVAGSSRLGWRRQFCERRVRSRTEKRWRLHPYIARVNLVRLKHRVRR